MSSLAAGAVGGAIGGGLAVTVLAPLTAANNFIGSFFFGDGMIIGERKAYQNDWPKIKKRMDDGESFLNILEEYTIDNTTAVMSSARQIIEIVKPIWFEMVSDYLKSIPQELMNLITAPPATRTTIPGAAAVAAGVPDWVIDLGGAAFAEEQKNTQQFRDTGKKFASDYEIEADRLPFKLLTSIVSKFGSTPSTKTFTVEMRIGYKNSFFRREKEIQSKQRTVQEGIETSSTGLVKQIATKYNTIVLLLKSYLRTRTSTKLKLFYATVKSYNQFVQLNRKRDMTIDAAKTIALRRLTLRYK